jgi:hypothetical protein
MSGWSWLMSGWCHINVIVMMSGKTWLMSGATCALPVRIPVYSSLFKHEGLCDETQWLSRLGAESGIGTGTHIHTYTRTRVCMNIQSTPWCVCVLLGKRGALTRKHTHTCVLSTLPRTHTHTHTPRAHTHRWDTILGSKPVSASLGTVAGPATAHAERQEAQVT